VASAPVGQATLGNGVYPVAARAAVWMLTLNGLLFAAKAFVGWYGGSYSLIADGMNNLTDVGLSLALLVAMKWAGRPADARHPYGHGRMEPEIARLVGMVIIATAGFLAMGAWHRVFVRHAPPDVSVLVTCAIGIVVKEGMFRYQRGLARRLGSIALKADALNHRTDVGASAAVLIGTAAIWIGGPPSAYWDDVAAFIVAALMGIGAARVVWLASRELLDEIPPSDVIAGVREAALQLREQGVLGTEKIVGRKMGSYYVLDLHLEVPPEMSVQAAHHLGHQVRERVLNRMGEVSDVLVHIEPCPGRR